MAASSKMLKMNARDKRNMYKIEKIENSQIAHGWQALAGSKTAEIPYSIHKSFLTETYSRLYSIILRGFKYFCNLKSKL
jgi:hypothetical protein